jgi:hypothetical protein
LAEYNVVNCELTEISVNFGKTYIKDGDTVQKDVIFGHVDWILEETEYGIKKAI